MTVRADEELFRVPPADFVVARDALAKRLRAEGDKAAAAEVKALRRPTAAAWAVNQVARDHPELIDAVVAAGARLVEAQEELLATGDRRALRDATAARRDAVTAATRAAVALAGPSQRDAVHATFDAATTDDEAAEAVRSGRLTRELDPPSGFALLGDVALVAPEAPDEPPAPAIDEAALADARARLATARAEARDAEARREAVAVQLDEATDAVNAAKRSIEEAEAEVARLSDP